MYIINIMNEIQILGIIILVIIVLLMLEYYKLNKSRILNTKNEDVFVSILNDQFQFDNLNIKVGDKVIFRNMSMLRHNITNNYENIPNSPLLLQYDTFEYRFNKPGSFIFKSSLYDDMEDIVINVN